MMHSPSMTAAAMALERIRDGLDETRLHHDIDEPIDGAVAAFRVAEGPPLSHRRFHQIIAGFVRHVYRLGLALPQELTLAQAGAEAIFLLEGGYRGSHSRGYDAALLDALNPEHNGFELVLAQLAEIIKDNERRKHTHWVFASTLGPLEWSIKCQIAELLLQRLGPFLTRQTGQCAPAQILDEIPALIGADLSTNALLRPWPDSAASLRDI